MKIQPQPDDSRLDLTVAALQSPIAVRPGLLERSLHRARRRRRQGIGGITTVVAAAAVAVVALIGGSSHHDGITFALVAPQSTGISLVGDFTGWQKDRVRLKRVEGDHWKVTLKLPPGRYRFAYVTDGGKWLADPDAAPAFDDFGRPTSVLTVTAQ